MNMIEPISSIEYRFLVMFLETLVELEVLDIVDLLNVDDKLMRYDLIAYTEKEET